MDSDGQQLRSDSDDEQTQITLKTQEETNQASMVSQQPNKPEPKIQEPDSDEDSQIQDLIEKHSSENSDSDESGFEYEDEEINIEEKSNRDSEEDEINEAFDRENEDENVYDDEDELKEEKPDTYYKKEFDGPKIKVNLRDYQKTLFQKSQDRNSIVYLPTGLGKTRIAIASMYYYLSFTQKKKIVFLANTVQLVKQQADAIKRTLHGILQDKSLCKQINKKHAGNEVFLDWSWDRICREVVCIHGQKNEELGQTKKKKIESALMSKKQFMRKFQNSTVIVVISQMFLNCLRRGFIKLTDFSFIVFDECHHCKGDHPYAGIMNEFYFDLKKKIEKGAKNIDKNQTLPKIMGLTASPIPDPEKNEKKLEKMIEELCINLDSNFVEYPKSQQTNQTEIKIIKIQETEQKKEYPWLLNFFAQRTLHRYAYQKLESHFPLYFQCVKQVIDLMSSRHDCLKLNRDSKEIYHPELFFFYDIKECLLNKIRDLWLELGEYVMCLALGDLITQLNNVSGLKDPANEQLLNDVIKILLKHEMRLKEQLEFSKMPEKYFSAKLLKLIELLTPKQDVITTDDRIQQSDSVLVFAFKRRTVEYLDKFFDKYRQKLSQEKRKYFECTGVTGYSVRNTVRVLNEGISYETNPSAQSEDFLIDDGYKKYLEDYQQSMRTTEGVSKELQSELNRFRNAKITKFLLETEEKYSSQLRKINQFRKRQKRVLISTSVTEQGFDIPGCNKVISFDTPFSMKAYIQIKGRARKKNSIYYIFTTEVNHKKMIEDAQMYDDTINATYEIAINRIAKKEIRAEKKKEKEGYKKVPTKGGALLNSNYALEILKIYLATLAQPNKGYFQYILTPNICYKCIIKMPASDPSGIPMFVGQACSTKVQALKSSAFIAVRQLKIMGLIKDDLRPSKIQQLEDQYELQKYNDLQTLQTDQDYKHIFQTYTQFQEEKEIGSNRSFLRIYFKSIRSEELDFQQINPKFEKSLYDFNNKGIKFPFQLYHVSFSNTRNHTFMKQYDNSNEIGLLTCFDEALNAKLFANFCYKFEENPNESFTLKKVDTAVELTLQEYNKLKMVHEFLVAGSDNRQIMYYSEQTNIQVQNKQFQMALDNASYVFDKKRKFYPLMVLLKSHKQPGKAQKRYEIDQNKTQKVKQHKELFKKLYQYNNRPKFSRINQKFSEDLIEEYEAFAHHIQGNETITLVQSITTDFLFHKCLIKSRIKYSQQVIDESKNNTLSKHNLEKRQSKYRAMFDHFKSENSDLVQRELWRDFEKDKRMAFFDQGGIKQETMKNERYYLLKEFVEYPISPQTLFRLTLAKKYVYDALSSYTKALAFTNIRLKQLFMVRHDKPYHPLMFQHYQNIILSNSDLIFEHLADNGKSKLLRELGRSYKSKLINESLNHSFDKSQIVNMSEISEIQQNNSIDQSVMQDNSMSVLNIKPQIINDDIELSPNKRIYTFSFDLLDKLRIPDVQKVLTSKTYKHQKSENYEEFQFIGDVVLKYLATLEIFCTRPKAVEGQMHIARANIICNANLHRKAIKSEIFRYIMASKNQEICPPYKLSYDESKVEKEKYTGKNNEYESLNIMKVNKASESQGYQYIAGKVHADVVEALIGAFYYAERKLQHCQELLYALDVLRSPSLMIDLDFKRAQRYDNLPGCYYQLEQNIGYEFKHKGLMIQALTHQTFRTTLETIIDDRNITKILETTTQSELSRFSLLSEQVQDYRTKIRFHETFYERLEFLGDAVLDLIVVEHLYDKYDRGLDQGTLTLLKQAGVSNKSLGLIAVKFKLHQLTLMDIPELDNLQREFAKLRSSFDEYIAHPQKLHAIQINEIKLLGDVFEGLIGAILIDNNFDYQITKNIVWKMIGKYIEVFTDKNHIKGLTVMNFLKNNNYANCRIEKISKNTKDGKFQYGLIDRKHTTIEKCYACNEKDAWDVIMEKIEAKNKGALIEEQESEDEGVL